nr:uncharacterized protein LOC109179527 [Ipomoea trifida]
MVDLKRCIVALSIVYITLTTLALHTNAANFCATAIDKPLCEKIVHGSEPHNYQGNPISLPRFTRLVITGYEVPLQATMKARLRCHLTAELEILGKCISDPC